MTQRDAILAALLRRGWTQDFTTRCNPRRYLVLEHSAVPLRLFLGRNGSLRRGVNRTGSLPVAESFKRALLDERVQ